MSAAVRILDWKPRSSGVLRGFADVEFPSVAIFHEVGIFELNGRWWASPASKPQISREGTVLKDDRGKTKYVPIVSFVDKARPDLWSNAVVAAVHCERTVLKDDRGKTKYIPVVSFVDKARRDLWSSAVITAVHAVHPEVLA